MANVSLKTHNEGKYDVSAEELSALRVALRGAACLPGEAGHEEARSIWNAMFDRHPGLVVRCVGAGDVMRAVSFARRHGLLVAVRGGGHSIAGNAVCDDGLMIDLSPMKSVRVNPATRRAWVEPGATLGDLDKETQAALPAGGVARARGLGVCHMLLW
jgi:FAD/FMN-containing dehydrogenase